MNRARATRPQPPRRRKPAKPKAGTAKLVHELEVHQVELELQNEELRSARGALESALERYTEVFDFAPIGYAMLDDEGIVRELNHAGARLLGRERGKLIGQPFATCVARRSKKAFDALIASAVANERVARGELELDSHGLTRPARVTAAALQRRPYAVLLAFEDISDRIAKEAELARSAQALIDANRRKDEFLAALSHELRNPLSPIRTSVDVLRLAAPGSETARTAIDIIDRSAAHLSRLVEDLLDVTRIMRGKIALRREPVEIAALAQRVVEDHTPAFRQRDLQLALRASEPLWVEGDPARLVQIISNLLVNAEKFTPAGGEVVVTVDQRDRDVVVRVRDTGVGITPELVGEVFQPFAQGPQPLDREHGGLGLGLAAVKSLVELHGGTARIRSEGPGKGVEVEVMLPTIAPPQQAARERPEPRSRTWRILVIEDIPETAASLAHALALHGHQVACAHGGLRGLELAATFQPDAVLCDIGLPDIDGFEVARRFRADDTLPGACLVALTGYARPEDVSRAHAAGFTYHLAKPARVADIERLLAGAALR